MLCLCLFHFFNLHHAQCFNLFVLPNYMFTSLLLCSFYKYFLCKGYEISGEIALKNNHYYYYYYIICFVKLVHLSTGFLWYVWFKFNIKYYCKVGTVCIFSIRFGEGL